MGGGTTYIYIEIEKEREREREREREKEREREREIHVCMHMYTNIPRVQFALHDGARAEKEHFWYGFRDLLVISIMVLQLDPLGYTCVYIYVPIYTGIQITRACQSSK